jgi:hypothetical protein
MFLVAFSADSCRSHTVLLFFDNMPVPPTVGALPAAFRVVCIRCVRHMATHSDHRCAFESTVSSKCTYCTAQRGNCVPVSVTLTCFGPEADLVSASMVRGY